MQNGDFTIAEYKSLRGEIMRNQDFIDKLTLSTIALNFVIFSLVIKENDKSSSAIIAMLPAMISAYANYWHFIIIRSGWCSLRASEVIRLWS